MKIKLLLHHHTLAFHDAKGIWVQSFIGAWVAELAPQVAKLGLLLHETDVKLIRLDYCISAENVVLESLGPNFGIKNRNERKHRIRQVCTSMGNYTHLIVRGITPRQKLVMDFTPVPHKFFLLVGSLVQNKLKMISSKDDFYLWLMRFYRIAELKSISRKARMAANSPVLVLEIKEILGVEADFIPTNTITEENFRWNSWEPKNQYRILFVGRVEKAKGIEELVQAWSILCNKAEKGWKLDIVGPCSDKYRVKLELLAGEHIAHVRFYGFVPFGDTLMACYDQSDIYVLPSYSEGFPHSIWEAGARSIPVVCTPVGGIPGIVDESMLTFIPAYSVNDLVAMIEQTLIYSRASAEKKREKLWVTATSMTVRKTSEILINWLKT